MNQLLRIFLLLIISHAAWAQHTPVTPAQPTLKDQYSKKLGSIRFSVSTLMLGRMKSNETRSDTIRMMNAGRAAVNLSISSRIPPYLRLIPGQFTLQPDSTGWIAIEYNASKRNDFGFFLDRISLATNDSLMPVKNLNLTATIEEYFPPMNAEDSAMAPRGGVPELVYDYGQIRQGGKVSHEFLIRNDGKRDLIIHKVKTSSSNCVTAGFSRPVIAAGDSTMIHVQFDSTGKEGKDNRKVYVYVNDPFRPELILEIKGEVYK